MADTPAEEQPNQVVDGGTTPNAMNPVTDDDYIRGNPNAPIMIVEYSDFDCPFCGRFHETMKQVIADYGATGEVAWVYRHLPLEQLHPNAPLIAEASECVGQLAGDEAFWTFADLVFAEKPVRGSTDIGRLPEFAEASGVDMAAYTACMEAGDGQAGVNEDFENAYNDIVANSTPYSILVVGDQQAVLPGAQPYENVKQIIDNILAQIEQSQAAPEA